MPLLINLAALPIWHCYALCACDHASDTAGCQRACRDVVERCFAERPVNLNCRRRSPKPRPSSRPQRR